MFKRQFLNGKIHRARVTAADLHYVGSITLDAALMEAANIYPHELVHVVNINNGHRIQTYAIAGETNSGIVQLNGAAAHLFAIDELIIVMSYVQIEDDDALIKTWQPSIVCVDENNKVVKSLPL